MNSLAAAVIFLITGCLVWGNSGQSTIELEKQAIADIQRILARELDTELPRLPFANWFRQTVGMENAVTWQLSECGEIAGNPPNSTQDIRACVEANAILSDGRRVIIMIAVGTFKKGLSGSPSFQVGVIEQGGELYSLRRLRDLQIGLSSPESLKKNNRPAVKLPELVISEHILAAPDGYALGLPDLNEMGLGRPFTTAEDSPPQPPPERASGGFVQGVPTVRVQPAYPRAARRFKAAGVVEVRVMISVTGRVIDAKAISGHPLLRDAAVEAARKWEFTPAMMNGVPVQTQLTLSFEFTVPQGDD